MTPPTIAGGAARGGRRQHSEIVLKRFHDELVRGTHLFKLLLEFMHVALQPHLRAREAQFHGARAGDARRAVGRKPANTAKS